MNKTAIQTNCDTPWPGQWYEQHSSCKPRQTFCDNAPCRTAFHLSDSTRTSVGAHSLYI